MNTASVNETIALGAITGMRSMAGPAALSLRHDGVLKHVVTALAAVEILADKTSLVGDRIEPIPLAGRAFMGALVGGVIAREAHDDVLVGGLIGAAAAVVAAHLAYHARKRFPLSSVLGGVLEDCLVIGIAARYASPSPSRLL